MFTSKTAVFALAYAAFKGAASADKTVALPLWSVFDGKGCATNISIGSNNEVAAVLVYTNAASFWINPSCAAKKRQARDECVSSSSYNPKGSKTAKENGKPGEWNTYSVYYDGTSGIGTGNVDKISGTTYQDTATIGGKTAEGLTFGVAEAPRNLPYGELGMASSGKEGSDEHNLIDALVGQGRINKKVFSLQLPVGDKQGSLVFGGFDKKKYKCALTDAPLATGATPGAALQSGWYRTFLTSVGQSLPNKTRPSYSNLLPEAGLEMSFSSELIYNIFPDSLFLAIGKDFPNATLVDNNPAEPDKRLFSAPCRGLPEGSVDFGFGPPGGDADESDSGSENNNSWISIPYKDFIVNDGKGMCWLQMATRKNQAPALSESFFRQTYMVFDVDRGAVWMGQADDCGSEIVEVGKNGDAIEVPAGCNCNKKDGGQPSSTTAGTAKPTGSKKGSAGRVGRGEMDLLLVGLLVLLLTAVDGGLFS